MQNHNIQICILIQLRFLRGNGDSKGLRWLCKGTFAFPRCFPPHMKILQRWNRPRRQSFLKSSLLGGKQSPTSTKASLKTKVQDVEMQKSDFARRHDFWSQMIPPQINLLKIFACRNISLFWQTLPELSIHKSWPLGKPAKILLRYQVRMFRAQLF